MIKKMMILVIGLVTVFSFAFAASANGSINEESVVMTVDEVRCAEYSLDFVESYYNKIYTLDENNGIFEYNLTPANSTVATYIQERNILSGVPRTFKSINNYNGNFSIYEVKTVGEYVHVAVKCAHSFVYEGSKIGSSSGNLFFLTFVENEQGVWCLNSFHQSDLFDHGNIGWAETMNEYLEVFEPITSELVNTVKNDQAVQTESLRERYSVNATAEVQVSEPTLSKTVQPRSIMSTGILDKQEMMYYAIDNSGVTSPASGGYNVPYNATLFAENGGDCTNFISHCLLAGGARPVYAGSSGLQSSGWFYSSSSYRSYSWSSVNYLYNFLNGNTSYGPSGTGYLLTDSFTGYDWGDILQINYISSINSTNWNHSTLITGVINYVPYVTSRTSATKYNSHVNLYEAYPESKCQAYRIIVLNETYNY